MEVINRSFRFLIMYILVSVFLLDTVRADPITKRATDYTIQVLLEPNQHRLIGQALVTWQNLTHRSTHKICFHLYLNAFKNETTYMMRKLRRFAPLKHPWTPNDFGYIEIAYIMTSQGHVLPVREEEDGTIAWVDLPYEVMPGESISLQYNFEARLPRIRMRTGFAGKFFMVAQWFPKIGVLEENGWSCQPFRPYGEFYANFGNYRVTLQVPVGYVVDATGTQLTESKQGDWQLFQFHAEDVHDFAWFAGSSLRLLERTTPHRPRIAIYYPPGHGTGVRRYDEALNFALEWFQQNVGAYPYKNLTVLEPPLAASRAGGMEYPQLFITGLGLPWHAWVHLDETILFHQFSHQYWYGVVASDEALYPWLDEGWATYSEIRLMNARYGNRAFSIPILRIQGSYPELFFDRSLDWMMWETPMTPAWNFPSFRVYTAVQFIKFGLLHLSLEKMYGVKAMNHFMREYYQRYRFNHVKPKDYLETLASTLGDEAASFARQTLETDHILDYGVHRVMCRQEHQDQGYFGWGESRTFNHQGQTMPSFTCTVEVRRYGDFIWPVRMKISLADGTDILNVWDGKTRWYRWERERLSSPVARVLIDPKQSLWLDRDPVNNGWTAKTPREVRGFKYRWLSWWAQVLGFLITLG